MIDKTILTSVKVYIASLIGFMGNVFADLIGLWGAAIITILTALYMSGKVYGRYIENKMKEMRYKDELRKQALQDKGEDQLRDKLNERKDNSDKESNKGFGNFNDIKFDD